MKVNMLINFARYYYSSSLGLFQGFNFLVSAFEAEVFLAEHLKLQNRNYIIFIKSPGITNVNVAISYMVFCLGSFMS